MHAEIYHLKAAGEKNWPKMDDVIRRVETARANGLRITADMYTYNAGATGLDAAMPPWVQEGGLEEWRKRLQDPAIRTRLEDLGQDLPTLPEMAPAAFAAFQQAEYTRWKAILQAANVKIE